MSITGTPLAFNEADLYDGLDATGADELLRSELGAGARPAARMNEYITLYHPDPRNPSSTYLVPVNTRDRRMVLMNLLSKTRQLPDGRVVQWNHTKPVAEPVPLTFRCFVQGCQRGGGFQTRADVIAHVNGRHPNEAPLYQPIITRLMELVYQDVPAETFATLGLDKPEAAPEPEKPARKAG